MLLTTFVLMGKSPFGDQGSKENIRASAHSPVVSQNQLLIQFVRSPPAAAAVLKEQQDSAR